MDNDNVRVLGGLVPIALMAPLYFTVLAAMQQFLLP